MTDKTPPTARGSQNEGPRPLVREGRVMRGIVRNMVVNMECVLNDLQGIMGEIQSLVTQIDTVTDKIDKQCGAEGGSPETSQHFVRKPLCVHGSPSYATPADALSTTSHVQTKPDTSLRRCSHPAASGSSSSHQVKYVKTRYKDSDPFVPKPRGSVRPLSSEVRFSYEKSMQGETRLPLSSKSFSYFPKDGGGVPSPSGGIAIVHPTILCKPVQKSGKDGGEKDEAKVRVRESEDKNARAEASKLSCAGSLMQKSPSKKTTVFQQSSFMSPAANNESRQSIQMFSKQRHGITSVYNKSFQPVTPTEQRSPIAQTVSNNKELHIPVKHPTRNQPVAERSPEDQSPYNHKYCTIGGSLPNSPRLIRRSSSGRNEGSFPNSPRLRRSTTKPVYCRIDGSPASSRSSAVRVQQPKPHNYYYSIESDLDSDAIAECQDGRSMTPDIDWSYLNLIGNRNIQHVPEGRPDTIGSDHTYETPVVLSRVPQTFQMLQTSPDVVSRLPVFHVHTFSRAERLIQKDFRLPSSGMCVVEKTFNSPVVKHVFCSEVISPFESGGYCGCYEAMVDSVLENVAGFETFEEACAALDNDEVANETYVSFDDEFEEDDWDVGMKPDDGDGYEVPSFNVHKLFDSDQSLFGSLEALDDNRNLFSTADNSYLSKNEPVTMDTKGQTFLTTFHPGLEIPRQRVDERKLPACFMDDNGYDDMEFPGGGGNSFTDDDCCAIKPNVTGQHENFILWPKSFISDNTEAHREEAKGKGSSGSEGHMSSSDDASCQAIGSGSPMSFSSPEAAFTSPETERFVTSSEGDDLFISQEEAFFLSSETRDNANAASRKTNMRQLRREFFESLYTVCERHERERGHGNVPKAIPEEADAFEQGLRQIDNSRESLSETGSYHEDMTSYNKNVNTWTAYAMVHVQADDVSDSASDIINDNNVSCSLTSSYFDADNIGAAPGNHGLSF